MESKEEFRAYTPPGIRLITVVISHQTAALFSNEEKKTCSLMNCTSVYNH